ncbi:BsuPI-related putative proteinase inhibitor [Pleionea litopenaei]|uniref:Intracellular proteinase inhibitor BsuPI domain-containing protein n=1 Tax=Pleionea litopenaei TaxID=3070815 RepID=A0AA51X5P0_9GAMM|nr:BsuPI-related putative proteinase inhibitor [Pleionea sp. HL-JVS1]WMS85871.1 BsuPI-related putative proteinase inhibitor [Pleionea sp. HL-JVS1]
MMNALCKVLLTGSLVTSSIMSFANDFMPMQMQDQKVFKHNGQEVNVEVVDTYGSNWKKFSNYLGRNSQWVWSSDSSQQVYWFNDDGETQLLVDFSDEVGTTYNVDIDGCTTQATLAEKALEASTLAGSFSDSIKLVFNGNCADAGLAEATFAPGVGLVSYAQQSIIGPVVTELTSAKIAGVVFPQFQGIAVTTDFPVGRVLSNEQDKVSAYITLTNHSSSPEVFRFNSSQTFEIEILNAYGEVVNKWSANKRFTQALQSIELAAGASKRFGGELTLVNFNGEALDVGSYTLKIMVMGSNHPEASVFSAVSFGAQAPLFIDQRMSIAQ